MPLILGTNSIKDTGYDVANSCSFNDDDSAYMHFTPGSGNRRTFTISMWVKRAKLGEAYLWGINNGTNPYTQIVFDANDKLYINDYDGGEDTQLITNQVFRDVAAWYHIVIAYDTTQSTAANRVKLYINGTRVTSFATETYPAQNFDTEWNNGVQQDLGKFSTSYGDYYLAEVCMVEDSQLAPTSFGEFDEDSPQIWKPIDVSGLTFNTEGFYLDFEDSGDLGDDESGNGNDFTEVNFAATDQSTDTCTLNYSTFNPLDNTYGQGTLSEGNLKIVTSSSLYCTNTSTFNLTKGKWHFEVKVGDSNQKNCIGIAGATTPHVSGDSTLAFGDSSNEYSYTATGELRHSGSSTGSWGSSFTNGDIIGCAFDLDNNELFFYKNGTIQNSGSAYSITDPTSTLSGGYFVGAGDFASDNTSTMEYNFGSPSYSISSGNTDANGYGNFEHAPKSGHYAINSANLAEYG